MMQPESFETLKKKTILLVEDETIIRNNIASMLKFFFKDVYTAKDGYEGLEKFQRFLPDIIMTDLKMPYMGGFELLDEVKKYSDSTYKIVVSAHTDTDLLVNAVHSNIDRYIIKPVTEGQLFDAFESYLGTLEKEKNESIELYPGIQVDIEQRLMNINEETIHLNNKEALLLKLLMEDKHHTYTYEEIENKVWMGRSMSLSSLRSVIRDLRKKSGQKIIQNISGTGYKL
jgi:two-component system response regulator VanR